MSETGTAFEIIFSQVPAFPTLVLYRAGQLVATYEGDRSTQDMAEFIREHVEGVKEEL